VKAAAAAHHQQRRAAERRPGAAVDHHVVSPCKQAKRDAIRNQFRPAECVAGA
jgi:hypothetical protein